MSTRADSFAEALRTLEDSGDDARLAEMFSADADLVRPELRHTGDESDDAGSDGDGVRRFWATYRNQFAQISTTFTRIDEDGRLAVLEWVSEGRLMTGRPIRYSGASLLRFDEDDRVARFATYFDTAAFVQSAGDRQPSVGESP